MNHRYILLAVSLLFIFTSCRARIEYYVSTSGNDLNAGTIDKPFATIEKALSVAHTELKNGKVTNREVTIFIRGGSYYFTKSVVFSNINLERNTLVIKNYHDEEVIFTGAVKLPADAFSPVYDAETLSRLRPEAKDSVLVFDLKKNSVPYDSGLIQQGFGHKYQPSANQLYFNDEILKLSRWPNTGRLKIGKVADPGSKPRWEKPPYRGAQFGYDYDRTKYWDRAEEIWIYGIFSNGFSDDNMKVESFDSKNKMLRTVHPHTYGVYSSKDKSTWDVATARHLRGYYVYNLLEEIDLPGEYFIDHHTGRLYLWPLGKPDNARIELTELTSPFLVFYNTSGIRVSGIRFEKSRGIGIYLDYTKDISIENCSFCYLGLLGVSFGENYGSVSCSFTEDCVIDKEMRNMNNSITGCVFFKTGVGGIVLQGGDRKLLKPGSNTIESCEFYNYSELQTAGVTAISLKGVGNTICHCYIHDAPHMAIHLWGNNHLIEYNHIQKVCGDLSDAGAIYAGRDPSAQGTVIRYNFFDSIIHENNLVCAVYLDDGTCGYKIYDNLFYRCGNPDKTGSGFGTFHINAGYNNYMDNNIFIECRRAYGNTPWTDKKWTNYLQTVVAGRLEKVGAGSEIYLNAYPMLKNLHDSLNYPPRINFTTNDLLIRCNELSKGSYNHKNYWETSNDPGFINRAENNFVLSAESEVFRRLPGFRNIPFGEIGIKKKTIP